MNYLNSFYSLLLDKNLTDSVEMIRKIDRTNKPLAAVCFKLCQLSNFSIKDLRVDHVRLLTEKLELLEDSNIKFAILTVVGVDFYNRNGIIKPDSIEEAMSKSKGTVYSEDEMTIIKSVHPSVALRMYLNVS